MFSSRIVHVLEPLQMTNHIKEEKAATEIPVERTT
jgi:hypothetical protein